MNAPGSNDATRRHVMMGGVGATLVALAPATVYAASAAALDRAADEALARLFAASPKAREMAVRCRALLIFPKIAKVGLVVGGQTGDGVLRTDGKSSGYYNISAASYGLQAGVQSFSYVMFLHSQSAIDFLRKSGGWQVGVGPGIVVVDQGMARTINTTTLTQDVYTMVFGQKGLMAGAGLEGSKITRIQADA